MSFYVLQLSYHTVELVTPNAAVLPARQHLTCTTDARQLPHHLRTLLTDTRYKAGASNFFELQGYTSVSLPYLPPSLPPPQP